MAKIPKCATLAALIYSTLIHATNPGGVAGAKMLNNGEEVAFKEGGISVFSVLKSDNKENLLWNIGDSLVMTSQRMANLGSYSYINFGLEKGVSQTITTYIKNQTEANILQLSKNPSNLPVEAHAESLKECFYYNRSLSYMERQKVESYLALKYDITLSQVYPTSYFSSKSEIIWDAESFAEYSHNIAGIGRDDASGIKKMSANSASAPNLFTLSTKANLQDQGFILYGDNAENLVFEEKRGETKCLKRKWLVSASTNAIGKQLKICFDATQIKQMFPLDQDEKYWLKVKTPDHTNYYCTQSANILAFDTVSIQNSESEISILAAPDFFVETETESPSCMGASGKMKITFIGGETPYNVILNNKKYQTYKNDMVIEDLKQDTYHLFASDNNGRIYTLDFLLANKEMSIVPNFETVYISPEDDIEINADVQKSSFSYSWQLPDGAISYGAEIMPQSAGIYTLTVCSSDGCTTQRELEVKDKISTIFVFDKAFPNPTKDGDVYFKVQLSEASPISVRICDANGKFIGENVHNGESYYQFKCHLPQTGLYFVTLQCGNEQKTYKIVRE